MLITDLIQAVSAFNFLLFAGLIFTLGKKVKAPLFVFAFFLLGKGFTLSSNLVFVHSSSLPISAVIVAVILNSFLFFYAPFLYFFAKATVGEKPFTKASLLHFIPFLLFTCLKCSEVVFYLQGNTPVLAKEILMFVNENTIYIYYFQAIAYTYLAFTTVSSAKPIQNSQLHLQKWLKRTLLVFFAVWTLFFGEFAVEYFFQQPEFSQYFKLAGIISLLLMANITVLIVVKNPEAVFEGIIRKPEKASTQNKEINEVNYNMLCQLMHQQHLYKNAELKVNDVAKAAGLSSRNTSSIIKEFNGGNFYDFVNYYRIAEAKKLLADEENTMTILQILYEVGFNSKSVFNTAFKKSEGITPSEFKLSKSSVKIR